MKSLFEIYNNYNTPDGDGDKGTAHSYLETYHNHFKDRRENISLLEIGISKGYSLMLWKEYFTNSNIVGIDITLDKIQFSMDGLTILESDINNETKVNELLQDQTFDFIIDDGSHTLEHQLNAFNILFNKRLKDNGVYFIEDVFNIDQVKDKFNALHNSVEILDFRNVKNRYDDVLIVYKK